MLELAGDSDVTCEREFQSRVHGAVGHLRLTVWALRTAYGGPPP